MQLCSISVSVLILVTVCVTEASDSGIKPRAMVVADCSGTVFIAEKSPARSWTQAREYCRGRNMRLAQIRNVQQSYCLAKNAQNNTGFQGRFWTSAREARELVSGMLLWDGSNYEQPSTDSFNKSYYITEYDYPYHICGAFDTTDASFQLYPCAYSLYVLCQT